MNEQIEEQQDKGIYEAMAKAFSMIEGAVADSLNPHFKSKYADLSSVIAAIKPALVANGLFFVQNVHQMPGFAAVETEVVHSSGGKMSFGITTVPIARNDPHGYGSALTYARRYSLSAAFGVAPEDDDGNLASATSNQGNKIVNRGCRFPEVTAQKPDFKKLTIDEIASLADFASTGLMEDPELGDSFIDSSMLAKYFEFWQTKKSLLPYVNDAIKNDRGRKIIFSSYTSWLQKQGGRAA